MSDRSAPPCALCGGDTTDYGHLTYCVECHHGHPEHARMMHNRWQLLATQATHQHDKDAA